jgi:hypothetical protein
MRDKLTYANVTATLALFIALGGSSYAAVKITGKNVADGSLTTRDVKNRSLLKRDFKAGQLPAGAPGAQGPKGEQGIQGLNGTDGAPGAPGSAAAFAALHPDGSIYPTLSKNVDRSTHIGAANSGFYCLHTTVSRDNLVASLYGGVAGQVSVMFYVNNIHCTGADDPGYNVTVNTFDGAGVAADRAFMIAIN